MTIYANNVAGQLAANIGPSDTLLLLGSGQGAAFPAPGTDSYYATLVHATTGESEIVLVTGKAVDSLTVVRGRDATTAKTFTTGSVVELRLVAEMLRNIDLRALRGVANGYASLDAGAKVPIAQIPDAVALDSEVTTQLATKQDTLGFTPVQQGTGVGQTGNIVKMGWSAASKIKITIDSSDQGNIAMEPWVTAGFLATSARGVANGVAELDASTLIPVARIPALAYLPTAGGTITGALTVNGNVSLGGIVTSALNVSADIKAYRAATPTTGLIALNSAATRYVFFDGTEYVMPGAAVRSVNFIATSDRRAKKLLRKHAVPSGFADNIKLHTYVLRDSGQAAQGVIAQHVQTYAPHHVQGTESLGVDKAGLALDAVVDLAARIRNLERKLANA